MSFQVPIFFYNNLLKKYAVTVTSEDADYPKENLFDDQLSKLFKPTGFTDQRISIDAGAAVPVDIFALGNVHNLKTVNATVTLQHSSTGAWGGEEVDAFPGFIPATDNSYQYKLISSVSERYWSILLSGMTAIPQIGEVAFGARYTLPWAFGFGFDRKRQIEGKTNTSDGGQRESITKYKRNVFPCTFNDILVNTQNETDILAWRDAVEEGTPFWFLMDLSNGYDLYFVSMIERLHAAPFQAPSGYRTFNFTLEEEL